MAERVAVLGTGTMGAPMARNLLKAGFQVRVWNRTPDKARALATAGADLAETPDDALLVQRGYWLSAVCAAQPRRS